MNREILVAADFNVNTNRIAVQEGMGYAGNGTVHIVTVSQSAEDDKRENKMRTDVLEEIKEYVDDIGGSDAEFVYKTLTGSVPSAISEYASENGTDMIVMMTSWSDGVLTRSVTKRTISEAACPVLVLKESNY